MKKTAHCVSECEPGTLPLPEFFGQLLRLVYRLIFLLTAEDRELLHMPGASVQARKLYADGYSVGLLRDRAVRRAAWDRHHDRWEGLLITFSALASGEPRLGLPALGGLFAADSISDLEAAHLSNRALYGRYLSPRLVAGKLRPLPGQLARYGNRRAWFCL